MSRKQMIGWALAGLVTGLWATRFVLTDLGEELASGEVFPGLYHFVLCWPLILTPFFAQSTSRFEVQSAIYVFNSATFVFVSLIVGMMINLVVSSSRNIAPPAGGNHG